jgi:membrane protein implicated in regulation of membrane protease activity
VLYAYVAAAVVGLVMLVASLLGAGHDHAAGHDATAHDVPSPALALLSVRVWTYFLAFGGTAGALLRLVAHSGEPASGITAACVGVAVAAMARAVIGRASRAGATGTVRPEDLAGRTAEVLIPFASGATGKVRVRVAGADIDLLSTAEGGEEFVRHDEVLIVELRPGGTALVTRNPT